MKIQRIITEETQIKCIFWIVAAAFVAVLIPLFAVSYYNFRSVDDFSYAQSAEQVWQETGSVLQVFLAQIPYTWNYYQQWLRAFY